MGFADSFTTGFGNLGNQLGSASADMLTGGLSGAASGVLGGLISGAFQKRAQKRQQKYNIELMNLANEFTEDMWNKSNEYNTPSNQLDLYTSAGINPNVAIANMGDHTGASPVQSASQSAGEFGPDVPFDADLGEQRRQDAVAEAQINKTNAEAELIRKQSGKYNELTDAQIDQLVAMAEKARQDGKLSEAQMNQVNELTPILRDQGLEGINKLKGEIKVLEANEKSILQAVEESKKKIEVMKSEEAANYASAEESRERTELIKQEQEGQKVENENKKKQGKLIDEEVKKKKAEAIYEAIRVELLKHNVNIDDPSSKRAFMKLADDLANAKDENTAKRILKQFTGTTMYSIDYILGNAQGIVGGVAGYMLGKGSNTGNPSMNPIAPSVREGVNKVNSIEYGQPYNQPPVPLN